jgi:hypothetical protein
VGVEAVGVTEGLEPEFDFENGSTDAVRAPTSRAGSVIKTTVFTGVGGVVVSDRDAQAGTNIKRAAMVAATGVGVTLFVTASTFAGYFSGLQLCGGGFDCLSSTLAIGGAVVGGISGTVIASRVLSHSGPYPWGAVLLGSAGGGVLPLIPVFMEELGLGFDIVNDEIFVAAAPFTALVGGYLGFKLAQSTESSDTQVSVAPYIHDEGSGLMFSGQF